MVICLHILKPYLNSQFYKMNKLEDKMIQKPLKCLENKKNVTSLVGIVIHYSKCEYSFEEKNS